MNRNRLATKENFFLACASFSTYRLFILRLMHFLAAIGKTITIPFFSVLSLSYLVPELFGYLYHLNKEAKNAMEPADSSLQGFTWFKDRVSAYFTCLKTAWNRCPQRRYKMKNALVWGIVNLCTFVLPLVFPPSLLVITLIVAGVNLFGFAFDNYNEIERQSYDVKKARDDNELRGAKKQRWREVACVATIFVGMIFYFFPIVKIAKVIATGIILAVSTFYVSRNIKKYFIDNIKEYWNRKKPFSSDEDMKKPLLGPSPTLTSIANNVQPLPKVIESSRIDSKSAEPSCRTEFPSKPTENVTPPETEPLPKPTENVTPPETKPLSKLADKEEAVENVTSLPKPTETQPLPTPINNNSEHQREPFSPSAVPMPRLKHGVSENTLLTFRKSKSVTNLSDLAKKSELLQKEEKLTKWIGKIEKIMADNKTDNLMVILKNLDEKGIQELRTLSGLENYTLWEERLKGWKASSDDSTKSCEHTLFKSRTLLNTLQYQLKRTQEELTTFKIPDKNHYPLRRKSFSNQ